MSGALLYQWSTAAQFVSVLMIALFFLTLARSIKRAEVTWWAYGWWWNFAALCVVMGHWLVTTPDLLNGPLRAAYFGAKTAFALLLVQGAGAMRRPGEDWLGRTALALIVAAMAAFGAVGVSTIDAMGVGVLAPFGLLFVWCGASVLLSRDFAMTWLGFGFLARGLFALVEAVAYAADMLPAGSLSSVDRAHIELFLSAHSSIDLASEWMLALGGVLAITRRTQNEMERANADLLTVQEQLRNLADRDPLTGLANRRALPEAFRSVFSLGASLIFCDLDGFKTVNDTFGHAVGDACLLRFATALRGSFRPEDVIVRYAGDEFVIVCGGMELGMAQTRVTQLREKLLAQTESPLIQFSAGVVRAAAGEHAEDALLQADTAMYANKKARAQERAARPSLSARRQSGVIRIGDLR